MKTPTTRVCRVALAALVATAAIAAHATAQSSIVSGRVHWGNDSTRSVVGAEVVVAPGRIVLTDSGGRFRISALAPGKYTLRVRRIGFRVATLDVVVDGNPARVLDIPLFAIPQTLAEVVVGGRPLMVPAKSVEAYQRLARGNGRFFTREQIDSLQPYDLKSLLARLPGVNTNDRGITFRRCEADGAVAGRPAPVHVWVDGVRLTDYTSPGPGRSINDALRTFSIASVELVEVHVGISRIPPEFLSDACAVVLVWTR